MKPWMCALCALSLALAADDEASQLAASVSRGDTEAVEYLLRSRHALNDEYLGGSLNPKRVL